MRTSKKVLLALLPLVLLAPSLAFAATNQTNLSASLNPGTLSLVAPSLSSAFPGIVLNGQVQSVDASLSPWKVINATGTNAGWTVGLSGTQFTELAPSSGFATGTSALTLPDGSLTLISSGSVTPETGATPVSSTGGPYFENTNSTIDGNSFNMLQTNQGFGSGTYDISYPTAPLKLTINPATTDVDSVNYPGAPTPYQSTLTFSLNSYTPPTTSSVWTGDYYPGLYGGALAGEWWTPNNVVTQAGSGNATITDEVSFSSPISSSSVQISWGSQTNSTLVLYVSSNGQTYQQLATAENFGNTNSFLENAVTYPLPSSFNGLSTLYFQFVETSPNVAYSYSQFQNFNILTNGFTYPVSLWG